MIVVFGTICLDRVRRIDALPALGSYVEIRSETLQLGGEAANTAFALRQWGNEVYLVGNGLAEDSAGELVRAKLSDGGITPHLAGLAPCELQTPVCDVYITPEGERTMFGLGFAGNEPAVDPANLCLQPDTWFTAEPNMEQASRAAVRLAQAAGMRTYLMDFIRPDDPVIPGCVWQTSTDGFGTRGDHAGNLDLIRALVDKTGAFAILSDGANGLIAGSPTSEPRHYPSFLAPSVIDTTGAGDVFRAAMLHGLNQGYAERSALRLAAAAGALQCGYLGATNQVATMDELRKLIHAQPDVAAQFED